MVVSPTRTAHSVPCVVIGCASELIETCCAPLATFLGNRVQICSTHHGKLKDIIHCWFATKTIHNNPCSVGHCLLLCILSGWSGMGSLPFNDIPFPLELRWWPKELSWSIICISLRKEAPGKLLKTPWEILLKEASFQWCKMKVGSRRFVE